VDEKIRELIAIGASVGAHCQPCLTWHVTKARNLGIDDEAIREAIEVGHMVEKGAMIAMKKFPAGVLGQAVGRGEYTPSAPVNSDETSASSCC
jgi:AhpD family alkylhydroperoxidase